MGDTTASKDSKGRERVQCRECEKWFHRVDIHVVKKHGMTRTDYIDKYDLNEDDLYSDWGHERLAESRKKADEKDEKDEEAESENAPFKIGRATLMPRTDLDEDDQVWVPEHDEDYIPGPQEMECWQYVALGIEAGDNVLNVGPTGCGKSSGFLELGAALGQPVRRMNLHGDVRAANFVGEKVVDIDEESGQAVVRWRDGILTQTMRLGYWLLLDELDAAPPQILFILQSVLENNGKLVLTENHGEVVSPHPEFRILATANTLGRGDETGLYAGTNVLNEAFLDRFGVVVESDYPEEDTEVEILQRRGKIKEEVARKMVACAAKVRDAYRQEHCYCTFSTRRLVAWADKTHKLGRAAPAARITVLNRLGGDDREFVASVLQRYFPEVKDVKKGARS